LSNCSKRVEEFKVTAKGILDSRIGHLEQVYRTMATPVAVASTLSLYAVAYSVPLSNGLVRPEDVHFAYVTTLFFISLSISSYLIANAGFGKIFLRWLAIVSMSASLLYPLVVGQAFIPSDPSRDPLRLVIVAIVVVVAVIGSKWPRLRGHQDSR
jgi:hypothetical protein